IVAVLDGVDRLTLVGGGERRALFRLVRPVVRVLDRRAAQPLRHQGDDEHGDDGDDPEPAVEEVHGWAAMPAPRTSSRMPRKVSTWSRKAARTRGSKWRPRWARSMSSTCGSGRALRGARAWAGAAVREHTPHKRGRPGV